MIRIIDALARKRAKLAAKDDEGFTLIELLVVVIIIGILAAIAIPVYIGVQNSAKDSAVKSDLENAKTAVVTYFTQNGSNPADLDDLADEGFPEGGSVDYTATGAQAPTLQSGAGAADGKFCIDAKSTSSGNPAFHVDETGGVLENACTPVTP